MSDTVTLYHTPYTCHENALYIGFAEGLGLISYQYNNGLSSQERIMVGYRKGTEEFGYVPDVSEILSVRELSELSEVTVYPVPANDQLRFNAENTDAVTVYDITGKPVLSHTLSGTLHHLDISALSSGMYFGHLFQNEQRIARFKFVKSE